MTKGLNTLIISILMLIGTSAMADQIDFTFSPDSLSRIEGDYDFRYPGLQNLTVNSELTLPVKTIYLSADCEISDISCSTESREQIIIATLPDDKADFDNCITSVEPGQVASPLRTKEMLANCVYDIQPINKDGHSFTALSILPVIVNADNNIILCRKISITSDNILLGTVVNRTLRTILPGPNTPSELSPAGKIDSTDSLGLGADYIIITSDELAVAFRELADFKNAIGISTEIISTASIYETYPGLDEPEKIRNYLTDFYDAGGRYVLLGGNDAVIPARYLYYYNASVPPSDPYNLMPSDLYYADLDGVWDVDGDGIWGEPTQDSPNIVPELMVGRLPVMTTEAVNNYISKLILYQTNPGQGDFDYLERTLIFSSDQMRDYPSMGQHGYIADELPSFVSVDTGQTIEMPDGYDPAPVNPDGEFGIEKISEGFGLIHILAHGRTDGFRVKAANYGGTPTSLILTAPQSGGHGSLVDLEANGKVSLYYSLSCQVGGYDLDSVGGVISDWSFVEKIISAENAGGIGMVAYSRWGWVYSSYYLEASFTKHLYDDADGYPALAMYYSWLDYPYYRDLIYGQNYFGDPTLQIYRTLPLRLETDLSVVSNGIVIETAADNQPVPGVTISLTLDGTIIETGITNKDGKYKFSIEPVYGNEYCFTAITEGYTVAQKFYSPTLSLDTDEETDNSLPDDYSLEQNYPNPFNPSTTICYSLPKLSHVTLDIYNILGQTVASIDLESQAAGNHAHTWNAIDDSGRQLSSGVYFYKLIADDFIETKKMVLMK